MALIKLKRNFARIRKKESYYTCKKLTSFSSFFFIEYRLLHRKPTISCWLLCIVICQDTRSNETLFWFGGILGSASRAKFPVSLSNHVGFTPTLLYSSTHHFSESFTQLKTGWAQDAWLQWSYENWYFHLDISRWPKICTLSLPIYDKMLLKARFYTGVEWKY